MRILVTGSGGLIGSEAVRYYCRLGHHVVGIDNDSRGQLFGKDGSTDYMVKKLTETYKNYEHHSLDIRNSHALLDCFKQPYDCIIHCAAQPSHDKAASIPLIDFDINANATVGLLELTRQHSPDAVFIFMSSNKVYGDNPNYAEMDELPTRYQVKKPFNETVSIDNTLHSLMGVSKTSADLMVQEYGKYYGLNTVSFRGGCLTGPNHSGVPLHGFLSFLTKAVWDNIPYTIHGYKGKQVRDNIHSYDVIQAFEEFRKNPKKGEVYNLGGCQQNSISILEAISRAKTYKNTSFEYEYSETSRKGDHICYISDMSKFKKDYPNWSIKYTLTDIFNDMYKSYSEKKDVL